VRQFRKFLGLVRRYFEKRGETMGTGGTFWRRLGQIRGTLGHFQDSKAFVGHFLIKYEYARLMSYKSIDDIRAF
jgi:hypothetical protein